MIKTRGLLFALLVAAAAFCGTAKADEATPAAKPAEGDPGAKVFLGKCAGCHSVGGTPRSAPDLLPVISWKEVDLHNAIKRMEKNAGPLSDEEVSLLIQFLKDSNVRSRLQAEEGRAVAAAAATLEPPSASLGKALFTGSKTFTNGAASCASCHTVAGHGGTLGPDLTSAHARMGDVALVSAIEKSNFPVMRPIYASKPVTRQEASHIAAYLATTATATPSADPPIGFIALGGAAAALGLLALAGRNVKRGTRARLVSEAAKR